MSVEAELNNTVNNTHIYFNNFIPSCLDTISLRIMRYQGEKAVFAGKDTAKTVMHATVLSLTCIQS